MKNFKNNSSVNIGINALYKAGGGQIPQLYNMLKYFNENCKDIKISLFITKNNIDIINKLDLSSNINVYTFRIPGISTIVRVIWEQLIFPIVLIRYGVDILLCLGNISLFIKPVKTVQWIGTVGPFWDGFDDNLEKPYEKIKLRFNKYFMHKTASLADAVIFESNYTKSVFEKNYKLDKNKNHVLHIGKDLWYKPEIDTDILNKYDIRQPFALTVSHFYPFKNFHRMVEAYSIAIKSFKEKINLYIAGGIYYNYYFDSVIQNIRKLGLQEKIIPIGAVNKNVLRTLYSSTKFMIYPSPCENYAYTLVEAMSCGTPIACANTTAMPETCQDAALYFNPKCTEEIAEKIVMLANDDKLCESLKSKSLFRSTRLPDYNAITEKTLSIMLNLVPYKNI